MNLDNAIQLAIAIPVVCLFVWPIIRWAWRLGKKVSTILGEVTPNGGGSLNDRVCSVEKVQVKHGEELATQTLQLQSIEKKIDDYIANRKSRGYS